MHLCTGRTIPVMVKSTPLFICSMFAVNFWVVVWHHRIHSSPHTQVAYAFMSPSSPSPGYRFYAFRTSRPTLYDWNVFFIRVWIAITSSYESDSVWDPSILSIYQFTSAPGLWFRRTSRRTGGYFIANFSYCLSISLTSLFQRPIYISRANLYFHVDHPGID